MTMIRMENRIAQQSHTSSGPLKAWQYAINPLNNQIDTISKAEDGINYVQTHNYDYRSTGETQSDGDRGYSYNRAQRLIEVTQAAQVIGRYLYNSHGQRIQKEASGKITQFHYDLQGNLIAETDSTGALVRQYVYIGKNTGCYVSRGCFI